MVGCRDIQSKLGAFVDGELSAEEARIVQGHLDDCAGCAAEVQDIRDLAGAMTFSATVPTELWAAIERRLDGGSNGHRSLVPSVRHRFRHPGAVLLAAASLVFATFVGLYGFPWKVPRAEAAEVDFSVLLDGLRLDARDAFTRFLSRYSGAASTPDAARAAAPALRFSIPDELPGGFVRRRVLVLRFGGRPGVAATYERENDFLGVIFHSPVRKEDYGTYKDVPCVIGPHRGHVVEVGAWRLVHLTDPTTCHCILSRLDPQSELPPVIAAVAPGFGAPGETDPPRAP